MSKTSSTELLDAPRPAEPAAPKRRRDAERTRAAILAAARHEFTRQGFEGARIDAIAARARTNKRMLYHYFESKEGLYKTVLADAYREIRQGERKLDLDQHEPVEAVDLLVRFTFRHFLRSPWFIALLTNENLLQARYLRTMPEMTGLHSPLVGQLDEIVRRGADAGVFRSGVDPVQLYISIAALGWFYVSNNATLSVIFDTDLRTPERIDRHEEHVVRVILDHLTRRDGEAASP